MRDRVIRQAFSLAFRNIHVLVRLDPQYRDMLMANNHSEQDGDLVVEFMPRDYGHLPRPASVIVWLVGAYVDDTEHSWAELHPVWAVSINGGAVEAKRASVRWSPAYARSATRSPPVGRIPALAAGATTARSRHRQMTRARSRRGRVEAVLGWRLHPRIQPVHPARPESIARAVGATGRAMSRAGSRHRL